MLGTPDNDSWVLEHNDGLGSSATALSGALAACLRTMTIRDLRPLSAGAVDR